MDSNGASNLEWTESLAIGAYTAGEVQEVKDYGVIVKIPSHKDIVGFVTHYQGLVLFNLKPVVCPKLKYYVCSIIRC